MIYDIRRVSEETETLSISRRAAEKLSGEGSNINGFPANVVGKCFRIRGKWVVVVSRAAKYHRESARAFQRLMIEIKEPETPYEEAAARLAYKSLRDRGGEAKDIGPPPFDERAGTT